MNDIRRSPYVYCYLSPEPRSYVDGWKHFAVFLQNITDFGSDFGGWRVYTTMDSGPNGTGIDPLADVDAAIAFYRSKGLENDGPGGQDISASVWREHYSAKKASYHWGARQGSDELSIELDSPAQHPAITLDRFVKFVEIILRWQPVRYLWCGDENYWKDGYSLYDPDRVPVSWFCWVPQHVKPDMIPSAWRIEYILGGSLIVTQKDYFNDNPSAIERANAVEYEMNEAGLLPSLNDLLGYGS